MMGDDETMPELVNLGCFAANRAVIDFAKERHPTSMADRVRVAVDAALTTLAAQGFISVTPMDQWPAAFNPSRRDAS
jgi:hypothetical protein